MSDNIRSMTLLNISGDITLTWTEEQDKNIEKLIQEKIKEGYSFFSYQPNTGLKKFFKEKSLKKIQTTKNLTERKITIKDIHDEKISDFVTQNSIAVLKMTGSKFKAIEKLKEPKKISKSHTVAVKRIQGG